MDMHENASLTPKGREAMARSVIEGGLSKAAAARRFQTTPKTVDKWVEGFRMEGLAGLRDRSSRPPSSPSQATPAVCAAVEALRKAAPHRRADWRRGRRFGGHCQPHPQTPRPQSPVDARGGRASPSLRTGHPGRDHPYRHQKAGQVQSDRPSRHRPSDRPKQHPRGRLGICASGDRRPFPSRLLAEPAERKARLLPALPVNALRFFRGFGVRVERVMTDNGSSFRSPRYARALRRLKIKHLRTKPYSPKTNGKAERFVQTSLREWAYANLRGTGRRTAHLAAPLQLASPSSPYRRQAANQQTHPNRGQCVEAPQLTISVADLFHRRGIRGKPVSDDVPLAGRISS